MAASTLFLLLAVIAAVGLIYVLTPIAADTYVRVRAPRQVTCPETNDAAMVQVAAGQAALSAAVGANRIRIESCSKWPERGDCAQGCANQLSDSSGRAGPIAA